MEFLKRHFLILGIILSVGFFPDQSYSQKLVDIISEDIVVNSRTHVGGNTRNVIEVNFPQGTIGYVYRVSVFDIGDSHVSDMLFDLLSQIPVKSIQVGANMLKFVANNHNGEAVDYHILTSEQEKTAFINKDDDKWSACESFLNRISTCASLNKCIAGKVYFGFRNNNISDGLKVHFEIVALVDEANGSSTDITSNNSAATLYTYQVENRSNYDINFELSSDGINWLPYYLSSKTNQNYENNTSTLYFRISTNGSSFKTHVLNPNSKYKVEWSGAESVLDLFPIVE